jgi:hypothetical protein
VASGLVHHRRKGGSAHGASTRDGTRRRAAPAAGRPTPGDPRRGARPGVGRAARPAGGASRRGYSAPLAPTGCAPCQGAARDGCAPHGAHHANGPAAARRLFRPAPGRHLDTGTTTLETAAHCSPSLWRRTASGAAPSRRSLAPARRHRLSGLMRAVRDRTSAASDFTVLVQARAAPARNWWRDRSTS